MKIKDTDQVLGTIRLSVLKECPPELPKFEWRKIGQHTDHNNLQFQLDGQDVTLGPIESTFWMFTKRKQLPYLNAILDWFVSQASYLHQAIIDAFFDELSKGFVQDMQWYCSENYEEYRRNFPQFDDPNFNIEDPDCREQILTKRDLLRNSAITEIGINFEKKKITGVTLYCSYVPDESASEKINQMMAEFEGSWVEGTYMIQWDQPE